MVSKSMQRLNADEKDVIYSLLVLINLVGEITQQDVIRSWSTVISNPLGLDSEEDPNPTSKDFQQFHQENTAFEIVEMVQMWRQFEAPSASQQQIHRYYSIVQLMDLEVPMLAQTVWMFRVVPFPGSGEESQVPIFCHVPIERVE